MSASLAKRADVVEDDRLVALSHNRRQSLSRLETLTGFRDAAQTGRRVQAIRLLLEHPFIEQQNAARVIGKFARLIR